MVNGSWKGILGKFPFWGISVFRVSMPPTKPSGSIPVSSGRGSSQGWSGFVDGEEAELLGPVAGPGVAGK